MVIHANSRKKQRVTVMMPRSEDLDANTKASPKAGRAPSHAHSATADCLEPLLPNAKNVDQATLMRGLTLGSLLYFVLIEDRFRTSGLEP